jgi:two-component system, chemotaxis family, sensor kinase Cph1
VLIIQEYTLNLLHWLFSSYGFPLRGDCGWGWTPTLKLEYMIGNAMIAFSYFAIPMAIYVLASLQAQSRLDLSVVPRYGRILAGEFIVFIICCGLTHVDELIVFVWAGYRLFALMEVITGLVSVATVLTMAKVIGLASLPKLGEA